MRRRLLWSLGLLLGVAQPAKSEELPAARLVESPATVQTSAVKFHPAELLLGEHPVGEAGPVQRIQVRNAGDQPVRLSGWSVLGDASIESDCGSEIQAGAGCELRLRFIPKNPGQRCATVLAVDARGGLLSLSVSGKGIAPAEPALAANGSAARRRPAPPRARRRRDRPRNPMKNGRRPCCP